MKPVHVWTDGEAEAVMADRRASLANDPNFTPIRDRIRDYFEISFGNNPAPRDETGRIRFDVKPILPTPKTPSPPVTPAGEPIERAAQKTAKRLEELARVRGETAATVDLQKSLNELRPNVDRSRFGGLDRPELKEDGVFGPRTQTTLTQALVALGPKPLEERLAKIGRIQRRPLDSAKRRFGSGA